MPAIEDNYIQFFTAVCYDWLSLLRSEECKKMIINALQYRVKTKQVAIAGYVIMPNHIHIIWRIAAGTERENFQRDLFNENFLLQKLNYIHNNPCQPKWELVAHPYDYLYSSAKYYYNRNDPFQLLKHYADI